MQLKKGDKVICVKVPEFIVDFQTTIQDDRWKLCENKIYIVQFFSSELVANEKYLEKPHNVKIKINGIWDACFTTEEFKEHFITLPQLRKLKINKIYENN